MRAHLSVYEPARPVGVRDTLVPGPEGAPQVPVRIYTPVGVEVADTGLPGLVYLHGGGYVVGSLDFCHSDLLRIADQVGAVVVSVDYRLAPEELGIDAARWASPGTARAEGSPRPWPCWSGAEEARRCARCVHGGNGS